MTTQKPPSKSCDQVRAWQLEHGAKRVMGYRVRALKIFPWIYGRCARDFDGRKLCEQTIHHVDHNHDNDPNDGSNLELLCIYCSHEEHAKFENLVLYGSTKDSKAKPVIRSLI